MRWIHMKMLPWESVGWDKRSLTMYACLENTDNLPLRMSQAFSGPFRELVRVDKKLFRMFLRDGSRVEFRVMQDPAKAKAKAEGMADFFSCSRFGNREYLDAVVTQMRMFNFIMEVQYQVNDSDARTAMVTDRLYRLAESLRAYVQYPDMSLYCADRRLWISLDGRTELDSFSPSGLYLP